jgi:hypothetical protein
MKILGRILKWVILTATGALALVVVLGMIFMDPAKQPAPTTAKPLTAAATKATTPIAVPIVHVAAVPPSPPAETALIIAVEQGGAAFASGANDMVKGASRPARAKAICAALKALAAQEWLGTVEKLTSNNDGKGVLVVRISPTITLKTWNNALSDAGDRTLIEPGTPLFNAAAALQVGASVRFAGSFLRGDVDCLRESSMTLEGSMEEPEFLFRFTAIRPAE